MTLKEVDTKKKFSEVDTNVTLWEADIAQYTTNIDS